MPIDCAHMDTFGKIKRLPCVFLITVLVIDGIAHDVQSAAGGLYLHLKRAVRIAGVNVTFSARKGVQGVESIGNR